MSKHNTNEYETDLQSRPKLPSIIKRTSFNKMDTRDNKDPKEINNSNISILPNKLNPIQRHNHIDNSYRKYLDDTLATNENVFHENVAKISKYFNDFKRKNENILIPFDDVGDFLTDSMAKYQFDKIYNRPIQDDSITMNEQTMIKSIFRNGDETKNTLPGSEDSMLKVIVQDPDYRNPFESYISLKKNKKIYGHMSKFFTERQELLYKKAIDKFNREKMVFKAKMPKIRITTLLPKVYIELNTGINNNTPGNKQHTTNANRQNTLQTGQNEDTHANTNTNANSLPTNPSQSPNRKRRAGKYNEKESQFSNLSPDSDPKLFGYYKYSHKNFPEGREQFSFDKSANKAVLWGGISSAKNLDVWTLNPETLDWTRNISESIATNFRFGHTGLVFERKFVIFGGKARNGNYYFLADLEVYDLDTNTWSSTNSITTNSNMKLRRNHTAVLITNFMVVHGGITENGEHLGEVFMLNLLTLRWTQCHVLDNVPGPKLSGHSAALVIPRDILNNNKFSIYRYPDVGLGKRSRVYIK